MIYSVAERETIGLCICLEAVSNIVNHSLLTLRDVTAYPGETEAIFPSRVHRDLFLIRLLDFAKETGSKQLTGVTGSCLAVLKQACITQYYNINGSIAELQSSIEALDTWLSEKKEITLWLPSIEINAKLTISRLDYLNITGNHSKHNLSRLTGISRDLTKILIEHGYSISEDQIPFALDDLREHLAENYFAYYSTWLSELLNNIRWGLQSYLTPIFARSYKCPPDTPHTYRYEYPPEISNPIAQEWFWRLMNNIRSRPYLKKFSGAHYFKTESSLEWKNE
ncbi:hypothetical protein [Pseudomonas brassicacearum]|uniref:hypothetical protein n=1 Tax=Pseudomonas brassicacearum TaxID=930166 RepID=UPI0009B63113|nr:hypothetical protein [Pseudomonas brassicacearum]